MVGNYGLIEVDLMPTLAEEYSTLGDVDSRLTDHVVKKSIVCGLDLSLRTEDVIKKEPCILMFYGKIKKKLERLGALVILLVIHPITPPWVKLELIKRNLFQVEFKPFPHINLMNCVIGAGLR